MTLPEAFAAMAEITWVPEDAGIRPVGRDA